MMNLAQCPKVERQALTINPAKTCQPIGAVYASLGIHGCLPHSHGSQGCASYLRMHLTRHFREPINCTTSSFNEGAVVFGGSGHLKQAIKNILKIYRPQVIAIHTTCSAETIGDDVPGIIEDMARAGEIPPEVKIFSASTPSYIGSHVTGFASITEAAVRAFAVKGSPNGKVNVLPGFVNPGDMREIKRILKLMGIAGIVLPDTSGVLDAPMTGQLSLYPEGGTRIDEIQDMANSLATLALGRVATTEAAQALEEMGVPAVVLPPPIGIDNVDSLVTKLSEVTGRSIPSELEEERGRLVDMMLDAHAHWYGKKVAIFGDPDLVEGLTGFVLGLGMEPRHLLTGTRSEEWEKAVRALAPGATVISGGDLFTLHQLIYEDPVDLLLGNSYGKYIARPEKIPLLRVGFPITDRANLHHFPVVGYAGAAWLVERIGNTLLDWKEDQTPDHLVELML